MIRLPGGRKRSERLMKIHSFSNFTNTADNPLDEDGNEITAKKEPPAADETKPTYYAFIKELYFFQSGEIRLLKTGCY
ncbi:hypothetical protein L6452_39227 [Arctium lappa]|uniref:Uncharacterized protein n=1 Tax=Arctium lappa TaxID=4217 RepID=A0ACB8XVU3_ARCLA|nr:hypothetical protein L6452_39227 [Arctium lappa]